MTKALLTWRQSGLTKRKLPEGPALMTKVFGKHPTFHWDEKATWAMPGGSRTAEKSLLGPHLLEDNGLGLSFLGGWALVP